MQADTLSSKTRRADFFFLLGELEWTNPTVASYKSSAAKMYNATNSLVRFENKNIFFYLEKPIIQR
jgi:hypothetical protein